MVAFITPQAIWSSTQVAKDCSVQSYIDGLAGLDFQVRHMEAGFGNFKISVLSPTEVASRLAFRESFAEGKDSPELPLEARVQAYLRPKSTFRVTSLDQVWPPAHQARFA